MCSIWFPISLDILLFQKLCNVYDTVYRGVRLHVIVHLCSWWYTVSVMHTAESRKTRLKKRCGSMHYACTCTPWSQILIYR